MSGLRLCALLIRLVIDVGRVVPSERLIHDIWGAAPPAAPGNALYALVWRLRAAGGRDLVEATLGGYRLLVDPGEVDAIVFERLLAEARGVQAADSRASILRRALDLWRGPALAEVTDAEFAASTITRLEEMRLTATEELIDAALLLGESGHLVPELETLTAAHPLRERLRGLLMRALYESGRQADALKVFEETRRELADQLGVDPSAELSDLRLSILRQDPTPRPPAPTREPRPPARRTNVPIPITSFVGREVETRQIRRLLTETRLVTLTGVGGAGKTRLATEVAAPLVEEYPDGVWFVPMAPVSAQEDVPQAALVALGLSDAIRMSDARVVPPLERLIEALAGQRLMLLLDNCEHLIDTVARLTDRILSTAPGVRILATSREPLGITGEAIRHVHPLPLPPPLAALEEAGEHASIRLFTDRVKAVRPDFALDRDTVALVTVICRELDGIPLAIELAAARLRSLTLNQIADRLGDRFRLLSGGSRVALPRHQTLRAVVDWSWSLLDDTERAVLRRLSAFNGGATPESAQWVCGFVGGHEAVDSIDIVDVIASLIDKSLVTVTGDQDPRYRLLETIRAYAGERLVEAGELERTRTAHAAYFLDLAERAEPELRRRDQLRWSDRLIAESDNCIAALRYAIDSGDVGTAVRLVAALAWFWIMHDYAAEAGGWAVRVRQIAGAAPPEGPADAYAICTFIATLVVEMTGDQGPTPQSISLAVNAALTQLSDLPSHPVLILARPVAAWFAGDPKTAQEQFRAIGPHRDPWVRAMARTCLGYLALHDGQIDAAVAELSVGCAGLRATGERWGTIVALGGLTNLALIRGDAAEAVRLGEEAYARAAEGVDQALGALLISLGRARAGTGDVVRAKGEIEQGIRTAEDAGEYADAVSGYLALSDLARGDGDLAAARPPLERALELVKLRARQPDFARPAAVTYGRLGCLAEQERDLDAAAHWHSTALDAVRADGAPADPETLGGVIEGWAALAAARGRHDSAAEWLGIAQAARGYPDARSLEAGRARATARAALGDHAFDEAFQRGRLLPRSQALGFESPG